MAWPSSEIAVMGAEGAAKIIFRKEDPEALKQKMAEYVETFATPYQAAGHALIEQIIEPRETRPAIIRALKMLEGKQDEPRRWRKHGNMPL
jgi:acetyl-CoA carboxylase carboxyltransferase component